MAEWAVMLAGLVPWMAMQVCLSNRAAMPAVLINKAATLAGLADWTSGPAGLADWVEPSDLARWLVCLLPKGVTAVLFEVADVAAKLSDLTGWAGTPIGLAGRATVLDFLTNPATMFAGLAGGATL
jgi:hypothetical protein